LAEAIESRRYLTTSAGSSDDAATPAPIVVLASDLATPDGYSSPSGAPITPAKMRAAYGLGTVGSSNVTFGGIQGDGTGQTIAIVGSGDYPTAAADLASFDSYWGLPAPPSFQVLNATGQASPLPATQNAGEAALDVEWSHVMAPGANIILFEGNLYTAMTTAADTPGVAVVSISYNIGGTQPDSFFTTPAGHTGVTFLGASGDSAGDVNEPGKSASVISVGGTALTVTNNAYGSETTWDAAGGGLNTAEAQPTYQSVKAAPYSTQYRATPDVSMDAAPSTGVAVYDTTDNAAATPWSAIVGGTSLATPLWAGIITVVDQGRVAAGLTAMDGYTQTLPRLYTLPPGAFHDITTGANAYPAEPGYDLATGLGSPVGNVLIPDLAGAATVTGRAFVDVNGDGVYDAGDTVLANQTVYLDTNNNGTLDALEPTATTDANGLYTFTDQLGGLTGSVRLSTPPTATPYLSTVTTFSTAYNTSKTVNLGFTAANTGPSVATAAAATPNPVTAKTTALSVLGADTRGASTLTYTWAATTLPGMAAAPTFSANGTNAARATTATFTHAGTYVLTVTITDAAGLTVQSSVTVLVNQTLTSIALTPAGPNLTAGQTQQLAVTQYDQFGNTMTTAGAVTWSLTSGGGSVSTAGLYAAPAVGGTLAVVKATVGTLAASTNVYVVSAPWTSVDLGGPTLAGSAYDSAAAYPADTFTLTGAGNDVSGAYDQTHFVYQTLGGDGVVVARVAAQGTGGSTSAKAGVMIRASTDDAAAEVSMVLTPSKGPMLVYRSTASGSTTEVTGSTTIKAPYYVRLTRVGNVFTGAVSPDGTTWTTVGSVTVVMSGAVDVGLIQGSATTTVLTTATFDHVGLFGAVADRLTIATGATSGSLNVLANDLSIGGTTLTVTGVTQGGRGTVTFTPAGTVTYTASSPAFGADTFTYTMTDGLGDVSSTTVTVVAQGLQAYYPMNEGTGTTTADATGNGFTATLAGATWTTGVDGSNGLGFSGTSQYATAPALNLNAATVTLSGWIDRTAAEPTSAGIIFNRDGSGGYGLDFYNSTTLGYTWGSSASPYNFNTGLVPALNTWTFVALVVTSANATIYMEPLGGTLSSKTQTISLPAGPFTSVTGLGEDPGYQTRYFVGSMDEVRIYNAALTAANVASIATVKPTVATAAAASPSPVTGTTTALSVLGADYAGEAGLTYAWAATTVPSGAAAPTFSVNGTNGSKVTTATFTKAGVYTFVVTIADGAGLSVTSAVSVTVSQTLTAILVSPATVSLTGGATQQFVATASDQFGIALATQPTFTWSVDTGGTGTITSAGLYAAATSGGGTDTVRATVGAVSGTAAVTVSPSAINGTSGNDVIRLVRSGTNLLVYVNNAATPLYTLAYASLGALAVNTGAGTDVVNVDYSGGGTPVPAGGLTVTGGGGADTLIVTGTTGADAATVTGTAFTLNGSSTSYAGMTSLLFNGNGGADGLTQSAQPGGTLAFNGTTSGGPSSADALAVTGGTYTFPAPAAGAGAAAIPLASLTIATGATVAVKTAAATSDRWAVVVSSLSLTGGRLDLGGNDLVVHNGSASALSTLLQSGYANGAWSGVGIDSSAAAGDATHLSALGYAVNADATGKAIYASFDGHAVVATDVLVRSTVYGDANLDGVVNVADYTRVDAGFIANGTLTGWANGDFNYDGTVDGSDYTLIDNAFNTQSTTAPVTTVAASTLATPAASAVTVASEAAVVAKPAAAVVTPWVPVTDQATDPSDLRRKHGRSPPAAATPRVDLI
jgi:hypothetical protein